MAKALLGYAMATDPQRQARLAAENRQLRQRIADLESALNAAQVENDALSALVSPEASVLELA